MSKPSSAVADLAPDDGGGIFFVYQRKQAHYGRISLFSSSMLICLII